MKVLIYLEENLLAPKGGPYAVGYYIHQQLKLRNNDKIHFLPVSKENTHREKITKLPLLYTLLQPIYRIYARYKRYSKLLTIGGVSKVDLSEYDIVHFHKTIDIMEAKQSLESYKGIVMLTSHSPEPLSKEIWDNYLTRFEKIVFSKLYKRLIEMDEYAFCHADIIHFPCKEAEEPYYNNWSAYKEIKAKNIKKFVYIPTGIPVSIPKRKQQAVREELSISEDAFVISYMGRHNCVKGYDKLKRIGECILNQNSNMWIIVGGKEAPLTRYKHPQWIEVGWTNDAHSYIAASDIFVLPNFETYFDIVMLEVLSLGKIVVASRTGGNKYFERFEESGIFLYDTIEDAVNIINKISTMSLETRSALGKLNKNIYEQNFTDKVFVDSYLKYLDTIYNS